MSPEISLEHCYVLLQRVGQAIAQMDNSGYAADDLVEDIDPGTMVDHFEDYLSAKAFSHLFSTEFGKNILVGMFVQKLVQESKSEEVE